MDKILTRINRQLVTHNSQFKFCIQLYKLSFPYSKISISVIYFSQNFVSFSKRSWGITSLTCIGGLATACRPYQLNLILSPFHM